MPSPIVSATLQATVLSTISNVLAQYTKSRQAHIPFTLDPIELIRFIILTILTTPPNYLWQQWLERRFPNYPRKSPFLPSNEHELKKLDKDEPKLQPKSRAKVKHVLLKWFIDCMTVGALVNTVIFLTLLGLLKKQPGAQIVKNVRTQTLPIIFNSYKIWPIASIINFAFVPVERRIVFLSTIGVGWGVYMSLVAARM